MNASYRPQPEALKKLLTNRRSSNLRRPVARPRLGTVALAGVVCLLVATVHARGPQMGFSGGGGGGFSRSAMSAPRSFSGGSFNSRSMVAAQRSGGFSPQQFRSSPQMGSNFSRSQNFAPRSNFSPSRSSQFSPRVQQSLPNNQQFNPRSRYTPRLPSNLGSQPNSRVGSQIPSRGNLGNLNNRLPRGTDLQRGNRLPPSGKSPVLVGPDRFKNPLDRAKTLPGSKSGIGKFDPQNMLDRTGNLGGKSKFDPTSPLKGRLPNLGDIDSKVGRIPLPGKGLGDVSKRFENIDRLIQGKAAARFDLARQIKLYGKGDIARQLDLGKKLQEQGGWQKREKGLISASYHHNCFSNWYCGPSYGPSYCWFPRWSPWVSWCWWDYCDPIWDPRPIYCRPIVYRPCGTWVYWDCPTWEPLPVVTSGTWVDVPEVTETASLDLQLLAVRFVDPGHPDKQLGPRYRVWLRNNSQEAISQPFSVHAIAANEATLKEGLPEAGVNVDAIEPGQIQAVDLRLPFEANRLGRNEKGQQVPFSTLHVLVDSMRNIDEAAEDNNGTTLARGDILPVDPALFNADPLTAAAGSVVVLAGEGLGPEAGEVLLNINGLELQGEIEGWYDLGVRIKLPTLALSDTTDVKLVVVRGDGAATNPLDLKLTRLASHEAEEVSSEVELTQK